MPLREEALALSAVLGGLGPALGEVTLDHGRLVAQAHGRGAARGGPYGIASLALGSVVGWLIVASPPTPQ